MLFLRDAHNRIIRDLRVSLTDRCNFRCFYCLPNGEPPLARKETILTFEEIEYVCDIFVSLGIEKIRLTGGEPMLRKDIEVLIGKLARLKSQISNPKLKDLALTTNGHTFPRRAENLKRAGLDRVTISLDSLRRERFKEITGVDALENVFDSIEAAKKYHLTPVKINCVLVRGRNDDEIVDFARFARENDVKMRFIEFMPLDSGHDWTRESIVSAREIREKINARFPLALKEKSRGAETAWRYEFADGAPGEIGIVAPVTEMFCGACSRIRLTADGQIRTCLFSTEEYNLRDCLRSGSNRAEIVEFIRSVVLKKEARHTINDEKFAPASRSMSFIGG
ncbi:MAG: Cyclic pyranopterin phosphate synthase (MoaA) [uncultured Pyrinomonadaceae bacterium]|uniref:GTP 3',8-cyclase n=1 Tax=uncultured Pyrinomonadaceae bacterium TaxID=2283094 RepID=A0A6J4P9A5_9BACT|nr:MAG: Cyclic pyranopterin phosphate synthase (MoaA) [uncultured Pyrinomonadaceae bacterium]